MKAKQKEKQSAIELRKFGKSYNEIANILDVSKSSVSLWLRNIDLDKKASKIIARKREQARMKASETNKTRVDLKLKDASTAAKKVVSRVEMNDDAKRLLCAMLYWCEGVKIRRTNTFGFTNSDPKLIKLFLELLRENFIVDESKLRLTLHLHDYHDDHEELRFWSNLTTIPLSQCHKPYRKPHTGLRTRDGYRGCATIRYFDTEFARRLEAIAIEYLNKGL